MRNQPSLHLVMRFATLPTDRSSNSASHSCSIELLNGSHSQTERQLWTVSPATSLLLGLRLIGFSGSSSGSGSGSSDVSCGGGCGCTDAGRPRCGRNNRMNSRPLKMRPVPRSRTLNASGDAKLSATIPLYNSAARFARTNSLLDESSPVARWSARKHARRCELLSSVSCATSGSRNRCGSCFAALRDCLGCEADPAAAAVEASGGP